MSADRKQQLLKRHRRNKRVALLIGLLVLLVLGVTVAWWLPLLVAVIGWVAHEAWFADHLFYSPHEDYQYSLSSENECVVHVDDGWLRVEEGLTISETDTLILEVRLRSTWLGRFLDPQVEIVSTDIADRQAFERGVQGLRYVNLTGAARSLVQGKLWLGARFCRIDGAPRLWCFAHADARARRVMVIAPHADDAELAAFGLYSQASDAWIVTLTAGEIEAEHYRDMGLGRAEAARMKGRLRAWDSIAVPRWGGVPEAQCVQLGYFCMQLPVMQAEPTKAVGSREAALEDTRLFRQFNALSLPGDDGVPSWNNLVADLRAVLLMARPQVVVMPHPTIDPHPDHVAAEAALREALKGLEWQPETILGYANHLHDNDRWPMGQAHSGVSLPPVFTGDAGLVPYSLELSERVRRDKAMALGMMHDLQPPMPFKRRLRRCLQRWLAGRRHALEGENEFFRKAVRRHELFWRQDLPPADSQALPDS